MSSLTSRFKSLLKSRSGNVALITALALIPIVLIVAFAVDFRRVQLSKAAVQNAADTAVLAAARAYLAAAGQDEADRRIAAENAGRATFMAAIQDNPYGGDTAPSLNFSFPRTGAVSLRVADGAALAYSNLLDKDRIGFEVQTEAEAGDGRRLEIALVLDNTSSMFDSNRFALLREAAQNFVSTVFEESTVPDSAFVGVVPWTTLVNINSERPNVSGGGSASPAGARVAPGMDGSRLPPNPSFEDRMVYLSNPKNTGVSLTKTDADALFAPTQWRGCIRAGNNERKVSSSGTVTASLTDDPPNPFRWPAAVVDAERQTRNVDETPPAPKPAPKPGPSPSPSPAPKPAPKPAPAPAPKPTPQPQGELENPWFDSVRPSYASLRPAIHQTQTTYFKGPVLNCTQNPEYGTRNVHIPKKEDCSNDNKKKKTGSLDACLSDPNEFAYLASGGKICSWQTAITPWTSRKAISGPNMNCPTAMLGLSGDRAQLVAKIDHMYPAPGGTMADIGLMWGMRLLSPRTEWTNFFGHTGANKPLPWDDPGVRKVMVLLTDGKNEAPIDFEGYYGCTEGNNRYQAGACWKSPTVQKLDSASLNALTLDACQAIRDKKVQLYTILVDVSDSTSISLMRDCAGNPEFAYNISSAELDETFASIASRELRLTR